MFVLCKCACLCGGKACGHVHARAEQRQVLIPMMSRDTMRRVVVWASGRGWAEDGSCYSNSRGCVASGIAHHPTGQGHAVRSERRGPIHYFDLRLRFELRA